MVGYQAKITFRLSGIYWYKMKSLNVNVVYLQLFNGPPALFSSTLKVFFIFTSNIIIIIIWRSITYTCITSISGENVLVLTTHTQTHTVYLSNIHEMICTQHFVECIFTVRSISRSP